MPAGEAVQRLAGGKILNATWRLKVMLWVLRIRCFAMGADPSNARRTGQIISINLSGRRGPLHTALLPSESFGYVLTSIDRFDCYRPEPQFSGRIRIR